MMHLFWFVIFIFYSETNSFIERNVEICVRREKEIHVEERSVFCVFRVGKAGCLFVLVIVYLQYED